MLLGATKEYNVLDWNSLTMVLEYTNAKITFYQIVEWNFKTRNRTCHRLFTTYSHIIPSGIRTHQYIFLFISFNLPFLIFIILDK